MPQEKNPAEPPSGPQPRGAAPVSAWFCGSPEMKGTASKHAVTGSRRASAAHPRVSGQGPPALVSRGRVPSQVQASESPAAGLCSRERNKGVLIPASSFVICWKTTAHQKILALCLENSASEQVASAAITNLPPEFPATHCNFLRLSPEAEADAAGDSTTRTPGSSAEDVKRKPLSPRFQQPSCHQGQEGERGGGGVA